MDFDDKHPGAKLGELANQIIGGGRTPFEVRIPKPAHFADTTYDRVLAAVKEFQDGLAPDEEVGAMMAHFGQRLTIAVERIGYRNPFLITFYGTAEPDGHRCTLVQHMNQLSLLLVALKAKDPKNPRRIGFEHPSDAAGAEPDPR